MTIGGQVIKDVEAALPDEFESASQIQKRMGVWGRDIIKQRLEYLHSIGKVERKEAECAKNIMIHLYRRAR